MAFLTAQTWYVASNKYSSVAQWTALTAYTAGQVVRQLAAPAFGSERCFVCIIAGTSLAAEPSWTTATQGATTAEAAGPTWQECTGKAGVNGDLTNTANWNTVKNTAVSKGVIIQRISGASLQICSTAGTASNGAEPAFSNTAGTTTSDGSVTWTSLGAPSNFGGYAAPGATHAFLNASGGFLANNDRHFTSSNHSESSSSAIDYSLGTGGIYSGYSVNDAAVPPTALLAGATITTTGASNIKIGTNNGGACYLNGFTYNVGTGASAASFSHGIYGIVTKENCTVNLVNTGASTISGTGGNGDGYNYGCTFKFAAITQGYNEQGFGETVNCTFAPTGSIPTVLLGAQTVNRTFRDCDMSTVNTTLYTAPNPGVAAGGSGSAQNCKLNASVALPAVYGGSQKAGYFRVHNCDSGATNYRYHYNGQFLVVDSETSIVLTGGASDGTTPLSWKMASDPNTTFPTQVAQSEPIAVWNAITGVAKTLTLEFTTNATLDNSLMWIIVEFLGDAASPKGSYITTRISSVLATPVALTTSSATWGGTAQTNKYKIQSPSFTPQMAGVVKAWVVIGKPSITVYCNPLPLIA